MTRQVIEREKLGALSKIGQGGQGVVYCAPRVKTKFADSMVYKEYKASTRAEINFTALAAMPALVEDSLSYTEAERLISIAAWPCALVEEHGAPTGFVMPAIPEGFFIELATAKGVSSSTAEFQHLLNHSSVLAARGIDIDEAQRYSLLREVASGLAFMHKHGVCVGDISPKNLLFSLAPHPAVFFIDCDAMRINAVSALPQMETPGWNVPSGQELATVYSDTYKLGLLALRLLAGDQDTKNPQHLPATTPSLLRQIITDTLNNEPARRPLPEAWSYVLGHAIEHAQHQKKAALAAEAPVAAALTPPAVPEVRSRPAVRSGPPVRPAAPETPTSHSEPPAGAPAPVRSQRWPGLIAAVAVILAVAIVAFEVFKLHSRTSETPTAAPSSQPTVQSASASAPTAQPAPSSAPRPPTPSYFKTQIGRICEVTAQQVTCQSCIPGERITNAYTCTDPAPGIAVNTAGTIDDNPAAISSYSDVQQLTVGGTQHANGWTIVSDGAWTRFINDATGHGMAVAPQNRDSF